VTLEKERLLINFQTVYPDSNRAKREYLGEKNSIIAFPTV
jgi:hypothetical protein